MTRATHLLKLAAAALLLTATARPQSPVTITIGARADKQPIPADFVGLSFETSNLLPDKNGNYLFSAENKPLIKLFQAIGIKNIRVGGGTADDPNYPDPKPADIDRLFAFASAAGVDVIYTVRLLNGNKASAATTVSYIESHYANQVSAFQIGNEPDWHSYHTALEHPRDPKIFETAADIPGTAYPSFIADWNDFAAAINHAAPHAAFTGPDTGSNYPVPRATKDTDYNGKSWTQQFADSEKGLRPISFVTQHDYVGEGAKGVSITEAVNAMLSREWISTNYRLLFDHVLGPVQAGGITYRMTECNDYTGGVDGASNAYASALWALDYMHWNALHHAAGVNFHNKRWIFTDTIYLDRAGTFKINPKAYGLKAFALGSHGNVQPLTIANPAGINLTAYAVRDKRVLLITMIDKEHGPGARAARAILVAQPGLGNAEIMYLAAPNGDVTARTGITLGGGSIEGGEWDGKWTPLSVRNGRNIEVEVPAASAAIVRISPK